MPEQLDSVFKQIGESDEIVISDFNSTDQTRAILKQAQQDKRVIATKPCGPGILNNFEAAIRATSGDIIFLCDQDDVWLENKISCVLDAFSKYGSDLVVHDAYICDESLNILDDSVFKVRNSRIGIYKNIIKNSYVGCCMAFKKDIIKTILPIPKNLPMHDQWIGLVADRFFKVKFIPDKLIYYRRHQQTVTNDDRNRLSLRLSWRIRLILALLKLGGKE